MTALTANGVHCLDCSGFGNYYEGCVECPDDVDHVTEPVFITTTPLGRPDDDDFKVGTKQLWAYDVQE